MPDGEHLERIWAEFAGYNVPQCAKRAVRRVIQLLFIETAG
jgi:hypothetical protein